MGEGIPVPLSLAPVEDLPMAMDRGSEEGGGPRAVAVFEEPHVGFTLA
jgi:hypothetical protein